MEGMLDRVKCEIPRFIEKHIVHCDILVDKEKKWKSCLLLTNNLKFFEFRQKQLLASIDLKRSILSKVCSNLQSYKSTEDLNITGEKIEHKRSKVNFGKYTFCALNIRKYYLLIQCWDKLVVLQRTENFLNFQVQSEFEDIESYRLIHGPINYCPLVELQMKDKTIQTDFQSTTQDESKLADNDVCSQCSSKGQLNELLERVRSAQIELHVQTTHTCKLFEHIQNRLTFGSPFRRSLKLEEKQILACCGDIWSRFSFFNQLVIGIPLVNQCAPPNLTMLRNLQVIIQPNPPISKSFQVEYRLYQLTRTFAELDTLEMFLETEDEHLQMNVWQRNESLHLLPDSFAVLLVKLELSEIINLEQCGLILEYEIARDNQESHEINTKQFDSMQTFLKMVDFHDILYNKQDKLKITFDPEVIHQDFLCLAMSSSEIVLKIVFISNNDLSEFKNILQEQYGFEKCASIYNDNKQSEPLSQLLLYNCQRNSLWYGCLILQLYIRVNECYDNCLTLWKFYHPSRERLVYFLKKLITDIMTLNCNILSFENYDNGLQNMNSIMNLTSRLRHELQMMKNIVILKNKDKYSKRWIQILDNYINLQLQTDILVTNLNQCALKKD